MKLNDEQEKIRLEQEKLAGTTVKTIIKQIIDENKKITPLYEKEENSYKNMTLYIRRNWGRRRNPNKIKTEP